MPSDSETYRYIVPEPASRDPFALVGPYRTNGAANRDLLASLARDLFDLHARTGLDLTEWPHALAFVRRFYVTGQLPADLNEATTHAPDGCWRGECRHTPTAR